MLKNKLMTKQPGSEERNVARTTAVGLGHFELSELNTKKNFLRESKKNSTILNRVTAGG